MEKLEKPVIQYNGRNILGNTLKEYESVKISFSWLKQMDVLTESVGFVDDDNVGGFLGAWGN